MSNNEMRSILDLPGILFSNRNFNVRYPFSINGKENENGLEIRVFLPGVPKENVNIEVSGNVLSINVSESDKFDDWHMVEHKGIQGERLLRLPNGYIDESKIEASMVNGVLIIKIGKKDDEKSRQKIIIE